jgi:hypothetical protein
MVLAPANRLPRAVPGARIVLASQVRHQVHSAVGVWVRAEQLGARAARRQRQNDQHERAYVAAAT